MGSLAKHAHFAVEQEVFQGLIAACAVRVEDVVILVVAPAHGLAYLPVAVRGTAHQTRNLPPVALEEVVDTGEVARVAHVHGVGNGLDAWARTVFAGQQIPVNDVVGIVGSDEALHGQSHFSAEYGCCDVAEVAARYAYYVSVLLADALQLCVGVEIVERLRKEACHVDGVG